MTDISADTSTEASVAIGGSVTGDIETANDKDWIAVELVAGRTYQFDLQGAPSGMGTLADTFLRRILDAHGVKSVGDGRHRTYNDDFGGSRDSRVTFTATVSGRYYVEVSGDRDETGTYTLTATDVTPKADERPVTPPQIEGDDYAANTGTEGRVEAGGFTTGDIETAYDMDWIRVELVAGRTYQFDLQGAPSGMGTLADTFLRRIRDANGVKSVGDGQHRTYNDDFGGSRDSRVTFTPTESGTYYVEVSGDRDETGTYTLTVADVTPTPQTEQRQVTPPPPIFPLFGTTPLLDPLVENTEVELDDEEELVSLQQQQSITIPDYVTNDRYTPVEIGGSQRNWVGPGTPLTDANHAVTGYATGIAWFKVELSAGFPYRFEAAPRRNGYDPLDNPTIEGVYDSDGNPIAATFSFYDANGYAPGVIVTAVADVVPDTSGTYYVAVGGQPIGNPAFLNGTDSGWVTLSATQSDDYADSTDAPAAFIGQITVGGFLTGELETGLDQDTFAVELEAGKTYRFDAKGLDSGHGTLANPIMTAIATGNPLTNITTDSGGFDSGYGNNARFVYTVPAGGGGTYYFGVFDEDALSDAISGNSNAVGGTYRVEVNEVPADDDYLATTATTGRVAVNGSVSGDIGPPVTETDDMMMETTTADVDWFKVDLVDGRTYRIEIEGASTDAGTLDDPHLEGIYRLVESTPAKLPSIPADTNAGEGLNTRIEYRVTSTETFYIAVQGKTDDSLGTYRLTVTEIDDYGTTIVTAGTVTVGGSTRGRIHHVGDKDWFSVELTGGTEYQIDLKGTHAGGGTLFDPYLGGIYDSVGDKIPGTEKNNGGITYSSRLEFTPDATGTYYIEAAGAHHHTGTYLVEVEEL